jgi:hypothetical protein
LSPACAAADETAPTPDHPGPYVPAAFAVDAAAIDSKCAACAATSAAYANVDADPGAAVNVV